MNTGIIAIVAGSFSLSGTIFGFGVWLGVFRSKFMSKKERCKELMKEFFGPASAELVDFMTEEEVVEKCRKKVSALVGEEKAKVFDAIT